ncbi:MAG: response regulator [Treponema sp.]|nr:response regulator [Treponema sp.]
MAIKVTSLHNWDIDRIVQEIEQPNIKVVIYFFSPSFEKYHPQKEISRAFPGAVCIGSSMCGGWASTGAVEKGISIMSLSSDEVAEVYVTFQEGVKKEPIDAAHAAIDDLKYKTTGNIINPDEYLGLIFFDGLCLGELIMKEFSMEQSLNMAFVGGAAADEMTFTKTLVCYEDTLSSDGLVVAILKMKIPFFFNHYVHYLPTHNSFTITRVEIMKRIAWEINGEPAADFYARQVGVDDTKKLTAKIFAKNPLGLILGESIYIRSPNLVVDGKGLQFYCYIEAGTRVFLLKQGDIITHAQNSIAGVSQFLPGIQGCLIFNCIQRHLELIENKKIDAFNEVFSKYPMIGFNTYGEELFTHHNQTLTAVFFGTLPEKGMADPYKTKRLFHYTDSKLKSLVFDIVSRSELLNITISYLKGTMDAESTDNLSFETIKKSLGAMIEQSNISKKDIEKMLIVYQNNVEKTGEFVFNIVDEIRAQNRQLIELREEAETANRTKSNFLASMSHEIRTPMNAITGMAELLLRGDLTEEARGYAQDIKQAGNNLVSIINDILDFSKIEAGKMEIVPVKYLLTSLINDTINIIRMRLKEKPIRFYTNIDSRIPNILFGDEVRMRQVLINLLSNAAKFTERGYVSLTITVQDKTSSQVWLRFSVSDTGKGIKLDDQKKLFSDFVQVDLKRNRSIEGTGLGLAITKRLCAIMNGSISMSSEYGKGSTFTVTIPQGIESSEPFASVEDPASKKVLIYDGRVIYAKSVCWSLENMGVPYKVVSNIDEFTKELFREEWTLVLSGYGIHEKVIQIMKKPLDHYPNNKKPPLALMIEWGTEAYIPNVRFVSLPVQSLAIANVLNGKVDSKGYSMSSDTASGIIRYAFPSAKLLVVDDIPTNIKVAEGLMAPYQCNIDSCLSGQEAIELVKHNIYDIVFMDHMMPDMDGIEATTIIREWEKEQLQKDHSFRQVPVIALTANAVSGVRDMFIEKGFNDFLAKPIDVAGLDEILNRWISKEKRESASVKSNAEKIDVKLPRINNIDVQKGIAMTGGTIEGYFSVLDTFHKDAKERLEIIQQALESDKLPVFVLHIHALKSASAAIGATKLSVEAQKLEAAGKSQDIIYIRDNINIFTENLVKLINDIYNAVISNKDETDKEMPASSNVNVIVLLGNLKKALTQQKADEIDRILNEINRKQMDAKTKEIVDSISDDILITEYEDALITIEEFIKENA